MLNLVRHSLAEFDNAGLTYCSWKNNQEIELALHGDSDLDLLIDFEQRYLFRKLLNGLGYKEAGNPSLSYPDIKHFYGLDENSGKLVHLHAYFRLTTGESHVKNYRFSFEAKILSTRIAGPHGIPVPSPQWQQVLYLMRHYVKVSCIPGLLLFRRERAGYVDEYRYVGFPTDDRNPVGAEVLGAELYQKLQRNLNPRAGYFRQIVLGLLMRHRIRHLRRMSAASVLVRRYWQIFYRAINKLLLKRKKRLVDGGVFIAITGLDGSGKSSMVEELRHWLARDLDVNPIHIGRPRSRLVTLPFNLLLRAWRKRRRSARNTSTARDCVNELPESSLYQALRYYVLALDRYSAVRAGRRQVDRGCIVVADRYPSLSVGKMDSPRIVATEGSSWLLRKLADAEYRLYRNMGCVDLLLRLSVPEAVALERNRNRIKQDKESDDEIRERYRINQNLDYHQNNLVEVDTDCDYADSLRQVKLLVWKIL